MSDTVELDYVEGPGPGVVDLSQVPPDQEQQQPEDLNAEPPQLWEQATIETFLKGAGHGLHMLAGVGDKDWLMTEVDLERIAPPLTRICNRYEPILRAAPYADPLLVGYGFALYGWRSALERKRALRDAAEEAQRTGGGSGYERVGVDEQPTVETNAIAEEDIPDTAPYFAESPRAAQ